LGHVRQDHLRAHTGSTKVADALLPTQTIPALTPLRDALACLSRERTTLLAVAGETGQLSGTLSMNDLLALLGEPTHA
ncbi:MAG: hypothetical protein LC737_04255, partial [Chloroflexi bacterium]|nr:hypothetical protein [Chloroflexota bacterium]